MPALSQMKLLVNLAWIDGNVAERERNYIINIGRAHGIYPDQIVPLIEQQHQMIIPQNLTPDQKFDYIFTLVQLMKIDERMYKEEIVYCSDIARKLGYDQQIMFDFMLHIKGETMRKEEIDALKKLAEKYVITK